MNDEKTSVKDSNELLNIIMILLGAFYIFLAIMDFLTWAGIPVSLPSWVLGSGVSTELQSVFGSQALISVTLGIWSVISGIGMFREEEWAMGQGLVVLSIMTVVALSDMLGFVLTPNWFLNWINYITIIVLIIGVIGFFWLIFTRERYD